jgi:hypothetical protein
MEPIGELHFLAALSPEKVPDAYWVGGGVGPDVYLDTRGEERNHVSAGNRTLNVKPVAVLIELSYLTEMNRTLV